MILLWTLVIFGVLVAVGIIVTSTPTELTKIGEGMIVMLIMILMIPIFLVVGTWRGLKELMAR